MKKIVFFLIAVPILICGFAACSTDADAEAEKRYAPKIEMVNIPPAGTPTPYTFTMGSPVGEASAEIDKGEQPQRTVTLTKGFQMGKYEITQREYKQVTGKNPSLFQGSELMIGGVNILQGVDTGNLPVEQVSWYEAVEYCNRLSELEGRTPAYTIDKNTRDVNNASANKNDPKWTVTLRSGSTGYRLPTEAQWEFACRAGTTTPYSIGIGTDITVTDANFNGVPYTPGASAGTSLGRPAEVGSYAPNPWGLYDMHGNVYELCWDRIWQPTPASPDVFQNYYEPAFGPANQTDPMGLSRGDRRVERGGAWRHQASRLRSAYRERIQPQDIKYGNGDMGFRVVLPLEGNTW